MADHQISTMAQLRTFRDAVNGGATTDTATLLNDLTMEAEDQTGAGWVTIADYDTVRYAGTFNGNNYTISGLTISRSGTEHQGFFGNITTSGSVSNLNIQGDVLGGKYCSGFCARQDGPSTIDNCSFSGTVSCNNGADRVAGLVGITTSATCVISNCFTTGTVSGGGSASDGVGGLVGFGHGAISNSYSTANVINGGKDTGGFIGRNDGVINNCYASGNVVGTNDGTGGFVGVNTGATGSITNCYCVDGTVDGDDYIGGFCGINELSATIEDCHSIAGTVDTGTNDGGFCGSNTATITTCYYNEDTTGKSDTGKGVPLSTAEFSVASNFTGFDFTAYWYMDTYPKIPALFPDSSLIANMADLQLFREVVNGSGVSKNATLTASFSMSGEADWTPIGNLTNKYIGTFDGGNFTISNLTITGGADYKGLFGYIATGGVVSDLSLTDVSIASAGDYVGGLAGYCYGTITNCDSNGSVLGSSTVGGLLGYSYEATVTSCFSTGTVTCSANYIGGLIGVNWLSPIATCYSTADVVGGGAGSVRVGGLIGYNLGPLSYSYATGDVSNGEDNVGGLAGINADVITGCYATGAVTGGDDIVGGLVGNNSGAPAFIIDSYATGATTGNNQIGGLVGRNSTSATVLNCHSTGLVTTNTAESIGGLVGVNDASTVTTSYYNSTTSGQSDTGRGVPLTTAEYTDSTNFIGFAFKTWYMGLTMPELFAFGSPDYPSPRNVLTTDTVQGVAGEITLDSNAIQANSFPQLMSGMNYRTVKDDTVASVTSGCTAVKDDTVLTPVGAGVMKLTIPENGTTGYLCSLLLSPTTESNIGCHLGIVLRASRDYKDILQITMTDSKSSNANSYGQQIDQGHHGIKANEWTTIWLTAKDYDTVVGSPAGEGGGAWGTTLADSNYSVGRINFTVDTRPTVGSPGDLVLDIAGIVHYNPPKAKVIIHFDAPYASSYTNGFSAMQAKGWRGVLPVETSYVDTADFWTTAQLQEAYDAGWDLINKTSTHLHNGAITVDIEDFLPQFIDGKKALVDAGWTRTADLMQYPSNTAVCSTYDAGDYLEDIGVYGRGVLGRKRYQGLTGLEYQNDYITSTFGPIIPNDWLGTCFLAMDLYSDNDYTAGLDDAVESAVNCRGVLQLYCHHIDAVAEADGITTGLFNALLADLATYEDAGQVEVVTATDWINEVYGTVKFNKIRKNYGIGSSNIQGSK